MRYIKVFEEYEGESDGYDARIISGDKFNLDLEGDYYYHWLEVINWVN